MEGINSSVVAVLLVAAVSFALEVGDHWVRLVLLGGLMGLVRQYASL